MPQKATAAILDGYKAMITDNELDKKTRAVIAIAVATQIPCQYCVSASTTSLMKMEVTDAQIKEAVAMAAGT